MTIIVQPKRILITEFLGDEEHTKFIKLNTITDLDMFFNVSKEWVALYETRYKGQPVIAIPRRFPIELLERYVVMDERVTDKIKPTASTRQIINKFTPKDDIQEGMVDFLSGTGSYAHLAKKPRRALFSETGSGKTYSTLKAIANGSHFAFINCPDEKAILTWKQEIAKFTDIQPTEIGVIKGRESLDKLVKKRDTYKVILGSSKTFSSLILSGDYDIIEGFFTDMGFSLLAHDEAHLNILVLFILEMITNTKRTYYLTATPGRRIYKEAKLLENLMPEEACILQPEVEPRFEVRLCKYYTNPKLPSHVKGLNKPRAFDYLAYSKNYLFSPNYFKEYLDNALAKVIKAARKALTDKVNHKIAIVCKTKLENEMLFEELSKRFPDLSIGVFNSDIEDMDLRFEQTNANIILTTDKSFAGIVNIPKLEAVVLIHPITSEQHLLQIVGRIRKEPNKRSLVYIMADASFKRCLSSLSNAWSVLEDVSIDKRSVLLNDKVTVKVDISEL